MSDNFFPSLQTLPVEILHYILDDLDAQTILFSFRNTCRQFRAVVNTYNRFVLNFNSISKTDFQCLCRLAEPHRVTSLILSETNETLHQIEVFLSYFNLRQFNKLRSLSLLICKEEQLKTIVERFSICTLESFSLKIEKSDDRRKTTTAKLLSSIIAKSNISKLELDIAEGRLEKMVWPSQHSMQYLRIDNIISFDQFCNILHCLPHLQTLLISSISVLGRNHEVLLPFPQLTSLTLSKMRTKIDDLELCLSLLPSLIHLKLIGYGNYCDGNRWERFIQLHLPLLNKFQFFFTEIEQIKQISSEIKSTIAPFQTPFWLEEKKWFVTYESNFDNPRYVNIYSIPVCVSFLTYEIKPISISTYPTINEPDISIMDKVTTVRLDFKKVMLEDTEQKKTIKISPLFRKVKTLELEFGIDRPHNWTWFVTKLIDLTTIVHVKVSGTLIQRSNPYMLADMTNLFQQTCHVSSLDICYDFLSRNCRLTATEICSMIPSHVQHLAISIKNLNEIKSTLEQLNQLSSANFFFNYTPSWYDIIEWLAEKKNNSSCQADSFSLCVWLGKNNTQLKEVNRDNKRVKLTDEHYQ